VATVVLTGDKDVAPAPFFLPFYSVLLTAILTP
jgi:hypothetical protein